MTNKDTIAAIATGLQDAAIAIVRISGQEAIKIASAISRSSVENFKTHSAHLGKILDKNNQEIDTVILTVMKAPNSYTGEDIVEINCHGSIFIAKKILRGLLEEGARQALPGEFTMRAFLNEKIDLSQAEAVQDLISAKNELALKAASLQLKGKLSKKIKLFQTALINAAAYLEAELDFPEDLEENSKKSTLPSLKNLLQEMRHLVDTYEDGKILFNGLSICIVGAVNVGKSSLMNALLQKERSIISNIPGTTRDIIEDDLKLGQYNFKISDTAGVRTTSNMIEKEGIKRSDAAQSESDITLLVLDASRELNKDDLELINKTKKEKTVFVWNKIDLAKPKEDLHFPNVVQISAKNEQNIEQIKQCIENILAKGKDLSKEELIVTKERHQKALISSLAHIKNAIDGIENSLSFEFPLSDIKFGLNELSSILGHDVTEDILSSIFANFCIGK